MRKSLTALVILVALALSASGCIRQVGQVVTNVTPGPNGTINVERCLMQQEHFGASVELVNCVNSAGVGVQ